MSPSRFIVPRCDDMGEIERYPSYTDFDSLKFDQEPSSSSYNGKQSPLDIARRVVCCFRFSCLRLFYTSLHAQLLAFPSSQHAEDLRNVLQAQARLPV